MILFNSSPFSLQVRGWNTGIDQYSLYSTIIQIQCAEPKEIVPWTYQKWKLFRVIDRCTFIYLFIFII